MRFERRKGSRSTVAAGLRETQTEIVVSYLPVGSEKATGLYAEQALFACVVIDAIRRAKLALDRGIGGALDGPCGYFMKSPPRQLTDGEVQLRTEAFIRGEA